MAEAKARDWVLVWVEDLYRQAESMRFWEEEQEHRFWDVLFNSALHPMGEIRPTCRLSQWHEN